MAKGIREKIRLVSSAGTGQATPDGNTMSAWGLTKDRAADEAIMAEQDKKALAAGYVEYTDLVQKQVDAWKASK